MRFVVLESAKLSAALRTVSEGRALDSGARSAAQHAAAITFWDQSKRVVAALLADGELPFKEALNAAIADVLSCPSGTKEKRVNAAADALARRVHSCVCDVFWVGFIFKAARQLDGDKVGTVQAEHHRDDLLNDVYQQAAPYAKCIRDKSSLPAKLEDIHMWTYVSPI